ncbi:hypothetical protein IFM89_027848 [Coptis chinensis]|uniref:SWIM-type domain-containing protein n=1 Tax=Coptis chinensis TaxID=261450 RepID=A0A835HDE2_9MAGN|nr:hypothetical protein IFM89_027848 [Coptis chinensis]
MYKNFKAKFPGELWESLAWEAAMTYKLPELTRILGTINKTDSAALDWLDNEARECWARAHFDWTSKCDELTNNFSESFNSWILKIRDKPLVQFIDMYNLLLLKSIYDRRMLSMKSFEHGVVPNVLYMIKKREERYNNYEIRGVTETQYLAISHLTGKKYNLEIQKQECFCIEWQMSGVPCVHAVAVLRSRREPWSRYCSHYFSAEAFKATYASYLYPLDNIEDWPEITLDKELVLPPEVSTQPGRPRKQRIRADDEMPKSKKKCAKCQEEGHNSRSCDARKKGEFGKKKKRKAQVQDGLQDGPQMQQQAPPMQEDGPRMQQQAPPMQEDAPPMQQRKGKKSKGAQTEQEVSQQQPPPQVQQQQEAPTQEQPPGRGGRGRGALVQEVAPVQEPQAPVQEPQAPGKGGRGRPRGGRTGRGGNGRGRGREFSGLYGLLFGDDNVETPSTPPVNANQRAGEPLTQ